MASKTVSVDVINWTLPSDNDENIPVINQPNPCYGYDMNSYEAHLLIQLSNYNIYEAGTTHIINGKNINEYFPGGGGGGVTPYEVQEMINNSLVPVDERLNNIEDEIEHIDASSVAEYAKNEEIPRGRVVYVTPGQLYQATKKFTSNNDPSLTLAQSLAADVAAGNLTPVTDADVSSLDDRVVVIEEWKPTVDQDISDLKQAVISAEEMEYYDTFEEFPAEGRNDITYVDKTTGKTYTWNGTTEIYELMNTNNIIDGSVFNSIL